MRSERRLRRLVLPDGAVYRRTVRHRHRDDGPCAEVLTLHRDGSRTRIVFPGTGGACGHCGVVGDGRGRTVDRHEPGAVRAFAEEALLRRRASGDVKGWDLPSAAAVSRAAAATAVVRPGCPPGP